MTTTAYSGQNINRMTEEEKEKVVVEFLPKIKRWTMRAKSMLPDSVDVDDLYSAASLGLIECLDKYDKSRNVTFHSYAERRIKGAILDTLRNLDFLPRNVRTKIKELDAAAEVLKQSLGRAPTAEELAQHVNVDIELVHRLHELQSSDKPLSLDEAVGDDDGSSLIDFIKSDILSPEDQAVNSSVTAQLAEAIDSLPERERHVVALYYYEELTMKEIADVLDITESRVSQIHTAAMQKMKRRLKNLHE